MHITKTRNRHGKTGKKKFPEINLKKSFMVGDSNSDMAFGNALNMKTVFIGKRAPETETIDLCVPNLYKFAQLIEPLDNRL